MGDANLPHRVFDIASDSAGVAWGIMSYHPDMPTLIHHRVMNHHLKEMSILFNQARVKNEISIDEYKRMMATIWLPTVYTHIRIFGKAYVFPDIRIECNIVEQGWGVAVTDFDDDLIRMD
jgi:hypothetical protein